MIQKLQFISRVLLLVCLPAFVLKPVVGSLLDSLQNFSSVQKSPGDFSNLKVHYVKQGPVKRFQFQLPVLTPCFQKTIADSSASRVLVFAAKSIQHSPPGVLILRI